MLSKKIIIITVIIVIILGFVVYWFFIKEDGVEFVLEKAAIGTVIKEISETGTVKISEGTELGFKNSGRIEKIYVKVGDIVEAEQELAKLNTSQLYIELTEAQAVLEVAQADYNKLLAGSSSEEIKIAETEVLNTQVTLENAQQNLEDVEADAEEDLKQAYEDALDTLDDSYLKIYNAYNIAKNIQRDYFTASDQEGRSVTENKDKIKSAMDEAKSYINDAKADSQDEKIDLALQKTEEALEDTQEALEVIRNMTEEVSYRNTVPSADKTSLDNQKTYINTAHTNVVSAQQAISTAKVTNEANINTAEAQVSTAEAKLQKAQDQLALKKAGPTKENIDLYQAKIKQAQAKVSLLWSQIQDAVLRSHTNGQVTGVNKREGEMTQPTDSVISFLPTAPFQVEVDIYEEDIVDVKVSNLVKIAIPAFPDEVLGGRVISIDPAEKLIGGVVYYEVTISFEEEKEGIKPGMTADIIIESERKENVLVIPKGTVEKIDGKKMVQVFKNGKIEEREIEIGLEGDDFIEVISGLEEGEEVVVGRNL